MATTITAGRVNSFADLRQQLIYLERTYTDQIKGHLLPQAIWRTDSTGNVVCDVTLLAVTGNRKRRQIGPMVTNEKPEIAFGLVCKEAARLLSIEAQGGAPLAATAATRAARTAATTASAGAGTRATARTRRARTPGTTT